MTYLRCLHWDLATAKRCTDTATVALTGDRRMPMCHTHGHMVADEYREKLGWDYGPAPLDKPDAVAGLPLFAWSLR